MDVTSGLFALGGVALGGAFGELRAWRELRSQRVENLIDVRRQLYATAIRKVEVVASRCARWLQATDKSSAADDFWTAITDAYETLNELRLVVADVETAEEYKRLLAIYRRVIESGGNELPKPTAERERVVRLFRKDLGID